VTEANGFTGNRLTKFTPAKKKKSPVLTVIALVVMASFAGLAVYQLSLYEKVDSSSADPTSLSLTVIARETIANTWSAKLQASMVDLEGNLSLVSLQTETKFTQCFLFSFGSSEDIPTDVSDAIITVPMDWYAANGNQSYPVSIYQVLSPWKAWTNTSQKDGVTWASIQLGSPLIDRNPLDTVWVNEDTFGFGTYTEGNIVFDVTEALRDWGTGWIPEYGFLVSVLAPWETITLPWVESGTYMTTHYFVDDAELFITTSFAIPEFTNVVFPMIALGVIAIVMLKRRK
jgi:hypothetical protein